MRKLRLIYVFGFLLIAAVVACEIASPWWTLRSMRAAAQARDGERLARYIDFPQVRTNLREQLVDLAQSKGPAPGYDEFVRRFGASSIVDPIIDIIVSPASLRIALLVSSRGSGDTFEGGRRCGVARESLKRFRVHCAQLPNGQADLVFARRGLGWKLVGVDLPEGYGALVPKRRT